jgi:hypothetical protein
MNRVEARTRADSNPPPGSVFVLDPADFIEVDRSGSADVRDDFFVTRLQSLAPDCLQTVATTFGPNRPDGAPMGSFAVVAFPQQEYGSV